MVSIGGIWTLGSRRGGVTVRMDSPSVESHDVSDPSRDGCKADGGGDGRMEFGSTGKVARLR